MAGIGGAITPTYLMKLEANMRILTNQAYNTLLENLWWTKITNVIPSMSKEELFFWLIDTAQIEYDEEGNIEFEELAMQNARYEAEYAAKGLKVVKSAFEDLDGNGVRVATAWSTAIGKYAAYFPQKHIAKAIKANGKCYDGKNFFATDHPLDPLNVAVGTFSNLLTTGIKLDARHTIETAYDTLGTIVTHLSNVKMPNGEDPRNLQNGFFVAPPAMYPRLIQLLKSKFLSISGGSTDVSGVISDYGFEGVVMATELGAAYGGSDTDCYLAVKDITGDDLGGMCWIDREPFTVQYYSGQDGGGVSADLNRTREMEWHVEGRNVAGYGHPYKLYKLVGQAP